MATSSKPANQPTAEQRQLLQAVFNRFHASGEWPLVDALQFELEGGDVDLDVVKVGEHLDAALGFVHVGYQGRASLTIHGVALCSGADGDLEDATRTMGYAYARYRAAGPNAQLTDEDLARDLSMDPLRTRRTYELIHLWVPRANGDHYWVDYPIEDTPPRGRFPVGRLNADWHGLVELERRLIEPYVRRAAERTVLIEPPDGSHSLWRAGESPWTDFRLPLEVHEVHWWRSLLAPVHVQLLEGLLRVTEGRSGAALCKECGQPFLTLDARRSSFCTDRERYRFTQRERRKRLAVPPPSGPRGMPR